MVQVQNIERRSIGAIKAKLPTPSKVFERSVGDWLAEMSRVDGVPPWVLAVNVIEEHLSEYTEGITKPLVVVGPITATLPGFGDILAAGTCSVSPRGINLKRGDITYEVRSVPCSSDIPVLRNGENVGVLTFGKTVRMNGPVGWDRFSNVIAGAPYGFTCNMAMFLAWLSTPPSIPSVEEWKIPFIGPVNLSALYKYKTIPTPLFATSVRISPASTTKVHFALRDTDRTTLAEVEDEAPGGEETEFLITWAAFPSIPIEGFLEITPLNAPITITGIDAIPPPIPW